MAIVGFVRGGAGGLGVGGRGALHGSWYLWYSDQKRPETCKDMAGTDWEGKTESREYAGRLESTINNHNPMALEKNHHMEM